MKLSDYRQNTKSWILFYVFTPFFVASVMFLQRLLNFTTHVVKMSARNVLTHTITIIYILPGRRKEEEKDMRTEIIILWTNSLSLTD